ncbi:MAG: hypothetical protein ACYDA6_09445 [Solirubrobacteraceae bacterium]
MPVHLTPTELARESGLERREVLARCVELGIPVFHGCIDRSLFEAGMRESSPVSSASSSHTDPRSSAMPASNGGIRAAA